jgi:hypothetical protein
MTNRIPSLIAATLLAVGARRVAAQQDSIPPVRAYGIGYSPAAGLVGVEWVDRSFTRVAPRLGGAFGFGLGGVGARLNLTLRDPAAHRRVPYVGAGYAAALGLPFTDIDGAASVEGGVQFWPAPGRRLYADLGAGVAYLVGPRGNNSDVGPVLRLLLGRTF